MAASNQPAPIEQRTAALEIVLKGKGILPEGFV